MNAKWHITVWQSEHDHYTYLIKEIETLFLEGGGGMLLLEIFWKNTKYFELLYNFVFTLRIF